MKYANKSFSVSMFAKGVTEEDWARIFGVHEPSATPTTRTSTGVDESDTSTEDDEQ